MDPSYVDSHVHFWDPALLPYPWLSHHPSLAKKHVPSDLRRDLGAGGGPLAGAVPRSLVVVQSECDRARFLDEVQWVEAMAKTEPLIAAIVPFAPMDRGDSTVAILDDLARRPLVRGVRHLIQDDPDAQLCQRLPFVTGVRITGQKGLSFDLCAREWQLPGVIDLVRACPETRFVLDHAGKPDIAGGRLGPWRGRVRELAALPHVVCKLSGLVTEASGKVPAREELKPYVDHLIACFGPQRLLFGSDWPVVKLAASGAQWLETARELVGDLGPSDQQAIFSDTARRTYRLP
ncbi:MAG TPA: amidohydrolase family protein [Polyangiaceae bacterium]|nr:amidohydrolase family protein [Polyangiaceae bacterium]